MIPKTRKERANRRLRSIGSMACLCKNAFRIGGRPGGNRAWIGWSTPRRCCLLRARNTTSYRRTDGPLASAPLVVDIKAHRAEQDQSLDHLLIVDADAEDRH